MGIRWDAVVDPAAVGRHQSRPLPQTVIDRRSGRIGVRVRLFGALAALSAERSLRLELPAATTIAGVLAALGERLGEAFLAQLLDERGAMRRYCRLFVGGYPVEDVGMPLDATADPTEIDIILLIAPEGG
jgi:hypothetical protein